MNIYPLLYNFQGILVTNRKGKSRDGPTGGARGARAPLAQRKKGAPLAQNKKKKEFFLMIIYIF